MCTCGTLGDDCAPLIIRLCTAAAEAIRDAHASAFPIAP